MTDADRICIIITEIVPLLATLFSLIYGFKYFFKKGRPLCLQSLTMAMASHALGSIYHICQTLTRMDLVEGFTPAYLGRIGFFLFIITASYGQLDRIVDDGSPKMRKARGLAFIGPACAALLYIPNALFEDADLSTKIVYAIVWIPALISIYFNLKHALIPNLDFGFIKALKPYNILVMTLEFADLILLTAWNYYDSTLMVISSCLFGVLCVLTMISAKKGVEKWTI